MDQHQEKQGTAPMEMPPPQFQPTFYTGAQPGQPMYYGAQPTGQQMYYGAQGQPMVVATQPMPLGVDMVEIGHNGNGITPHPGITLGLLFLFINFNLQG